jgi:hypothetical protein
MGKLVYVAGPYTGGDVCQNVRRAMEVADTLINEHHAPFVPHLYHFMRMHRPQGYEEWMRIDLAWLRKSDVLVRLPGTSSGADREVLLAKQLGIPVVLLLENDLADTGNQWVLMINGTERP